MDIRDTKFLENRELVDLFLCLNFFCLLCLEYVGSPDPPGF